jgi:hypothetical protein
MAIQFKWKCSYLDEVEYAVFGDTCLRRIETYRGSPSTLEYMAKIYNGTADGFAADILARQNGCVVRWRDGSAVHGINGHTHEYPYHWMPDEYAAFVAYLNERYQHDVEWTKAFRGRHSDVLDIEKIATMPELLVPVPMYYDMERSTFVKEPFYAAGVLVPVK